MDFGAAAVGLVVSLYGVGATVASLPAGLIAIPAPLAKASAQVPRSPPSACPNIMCMRKAPWRVAPGRTLTRVD